MNLTKAELISIIANHSVRSTQIPDDLARWRRELADEIIDMDEAVEAVRK